MRLPLLLRELGLLTVTMNLNIFHLNFKRKWEKVHVLQKFDTIVATEEEIVKIKLTEPQDYNAKILRLETKGSSHGLDILTKEVIELRKELVKANDNHKALEEKIDLEFLKMREFVVDSNKKLLEDIRLFVSKGDGSSLNVRKVSEISNKEACETFSDSLPARIHQHMYQESMMLKTLKEYQESMMCLQFQLYLLKLKTLKEYQVKQMMLQELLLNKFCLRLLPI